MSLEKKDQGVFLMMKSNQPQPPLLRSLQRKLKKKLLRRNLRQKQKRRLNQQRLLLLNMLKHLQLMKKSMTQSLQEVVLLISILVMLKRPAINQPYPSRQQPKLALLEIDISSPSLLSSTTTTRTQQLRKFSQHRVCTPAVLPLRSLELGLMRSSITV